MNPQDYQNQLLMNRAIVEGMQAETARNPINTAVNNIVPNFTPADMVKLLQGYKAQQDLYEQKKAYETAAQGDAGNAQRVASAAAGQSIRNQLNKLGIDTSNADKLNAAGYAPIVEGAKRDLLSQIYSMPSSDEVYSSLYESKLRQGMGKRKAMEQAVAETEPYAARLDRMTKIAMGQLGTENGVMNNNGYTSALLSDNPERYLALYNSAYLMPGDIAKVDQKARLMQLVADIQSGQSAQNYGQQLGLLDRRGQIQGALMDKSNAHDINKMNVGASLNMQALEKQYSLMDNAQKARIKMLTDAGFDLPTAITAVILGSSNNGKKQTQDTQDPKLSNAARELGQAISIFADDINNADINDTNTKEQLLERREQIEAAFVEAASKGKMTTEEYNKIKSIKEKVEGMLKVKFS